MHTAQKSTIMYVTWREALPCAPKLLHFQSKKLKSLFLGNKKTFEKRKCNRGVNSESLECNGILVARTLWGLQDQREGPEVKRSILSRVDFGIVWGGLFS